jgi:hypothetical protein
MHVNDGAPSEQRAALVGLEPCPDEDVDGQASDAIAWG